MDGSLSLNELQTKYSSPLFLDRLVELRTIADFLDRSIVLESYEPSPKVLSAIKLTDSGNAMLRRLIGKDKPLAVRGPSIAALFLTMFAGELYIDPLATDIDTIVEQISSEIRKEQIRYPYVYGRVLYDRAFEKLRRNKRMLSSKETLELLEGTPIGVFQLGVFISGPYGLLRSCERRISPPDFFVPLYHCDDLSCDVLHETYLTTGQSKVSKARTKLGEISERDDITPGEWHALLREHSSKEINPFSWSFSSGLVSLLGDAFNLAEMKLVLADLLDSTGGDLRSRISSAINVNIRDAEGFIDGISEAQALQLILLCSDDQITESLNALILQGKISIPRTEVRSAITAPEYSGYFGIVPECTALGVRFATSGSLTLLRVRHLVSQMFDTSDDQEKERLAWLTRSSSGANFQEQLSKFICHQDLEAAVQALIFDSGKKLDVAVKFAGIGTRVREILKDESELAQAISWRLGIVDNVELDPISQFFTLGEGLRRRAMQTFSYSDEDRAEIRSISVNFFVALELLLTEYIKLATWSLLRDHYASPDGFVYHVEEAVGFCADVISKKESSFQMSGDGKWTLNPLAQSFGTLADVLNSLEGEGAVRPESERPHLLRNPSPYSFLFNHRHPYLDLSSESRDRIKGILREATAKLGRGRVAEIRNQTEHNSSKFPTQADLLAAISASETVIFEAEEAGFLPLEAWPIGERRDRFGRRFITLGTKRAKEDQFIRPSQHFLSGFPSLNVPQLIIRSAIYEGSDEAIRLSIINQSPYVDRWSNYPRRREVAEGDTNRIPGTVLEG